MLKDRTEPHRANLKDDYQKIQLAAEAQKKQEKVDEWIQRKRSSFFVKIDPEYRGCDFQINWLQQ
jgi:peptidyl-prolyl cis-trans isomerase SurA